MSTEDIYRKALEEHQAINQTIDRLKTSIHCEDGRTSQKELLAIVSELRGLLQSHFATEEDGGFMAPVLEERPQAETTINALKKEHEEILDEIDSIEQTLASQSASAEKMEGVCETIKNLIEQLQHHERTEDELIQTAYTQDIGTKD
jgi:hemerythrin